MSKIMDRHVFSKTFSYTDCLALEGYDGTLGEALIFLAKDNARAAEIEGSLWAVIMPTMEGYRVELFREEEE